MTSTATTVPETAVRATSTHELVSTYYGQTLTTSSDLKTNACCTGSAPPRHIAQAISRVHPTVLSKYYGCGLCIPDLLTGLTVVDLGCGAGRDVYVLSQLVGPDGIVHGVDMTPEQLQIAQEYQQYHQEKFNYATNNVFFHQGYLEKLDQITQLKDNSVDVIVSNCVLNLCEDKEAVLRHCHRLLKRGGEVYFSDVYASRRIPQSLREDPILYGECLSGALYWNDFLNMAKKCGFTDPRLVEDSTITIENKELQSKMDNAPHFCGNVKFYSATYRLFKLDDCLETHCEDFGQAVIYKGTMGPGYHSGWALDNHHYMETGKIFPVCGNTYNMLHESRFKPHFDFIGDFSRHYGIFDGCGTSIPFTSAKQDNLQSSSSCGTGGSCC